MKMSREEEIQHYMTAYGYTREEANEMIEDMIEETAALLRAVRNGYEP